MYCNAPSCPSELCKEHRSLFFCLPKNTDIIHLQYIKCHCKNSTKYFLLSFIIHVCLLSGFFFEPLWGMKKKEIPVYHLEIVNGTALPGLSASTPGASITPSADQRESRGEEDIAVSPPQRSESRLGKEIHEQARERRQKQKSRARSTIRSMKASRQSVRESDNAGVSPSTPGIPSGADAASVGILGGKQGDGALFTPGDLDNPPAILKRIRPEYPGKAKRKSIEGRVIIQLIVDTNGLPTRCAVYKAEPSGLFEKAALEAAYRMRFTPGKKQGRPVRTLVLLPFDFRLK